MREVKELLLKLQQLDEEIDALKADDESIPEKKQELDEGLKAIQARVEEAKKESIGLAKQHKEREIELEAAGDKKDKFKSQLFQVKSNREYEALQHEIAALDAKGSKLEDEILEILERAEQVSETIAGEGKNLEAEAKRVKEEQAKLEKKLGELRDEIAIKSDERRRLVMGLSQPLLRQYERIRASKGGAAVTSVQNGACGGCFRRIPPHEMQNLKKDERIITCEGCGRIIIWRWD